MKLTLVGFATAVCAAVSAGLAISAPLAYVPNEASGTVSVIDTSTDKVIKEIKAGKKPRGLAAGKTDKFLYVSDQPNNALLVIDLDKQEVVDKIALDE